MRTREKKNVTVTAVNGNSLNFELTKLKHRIQANCSLINQNRLYIFTRECAASV